jgi:uncharacterized membrane protein
MEKKIDELKSEIADYNIRHQSVIQVSLLVMQRLISLVMVLVCHSWLLGSLLWVLSVLLVEFMQECTPNVQVKSSFDHC